MAAKRFKLRRNRRRISAEYLKKETGFKRLCKKWITVILFLITFHFVTYSYTNYLISYNAESRQSETNHTDHSTSKNVTEHALQNLPTCKFIKRVGNYTLKTSILNIYTIDKMFPMIQHGGFYKPLNCTAKHKVAIIVPYRNRERNLYKFLYNIHPFLMLQQLQYQIFVIEQYGTDEFNKGRLYNAGFAEVRKLNQFDCVIFHDLDLLPTNFEILYTCPTLPRHMCARVDDRAFQDIGVVYEFDSLFGGVVSMTMEMFERANGYSNLYPGWGAEDNDMFWRLHAAGYPIVRYNDSIGVYRIQVHERVPRNKIRYRLLARAMYRYKVDGLANLKYDIISKRTRPLYTHILVEVNPGKENITAMSLKWINSIWLRGA